MATRVIAVLLVSMAVLTGSAPPWPEQRLPPVATTPTPPEMVETTARALVVTPTEAETARSLATLRKLDDHPLYSMTYYGPAPRIDGSVADRPGPADRVPFGCTLFVAAGTPGSPLVGRNFDWDHSPALVLHANPSDAYRSVSPADLSYLGVTADVPAAGATLTKAVTLPFDGMNEHGLVIGMAALDHARGELRPGRPAVGSVGVMRLVLDRARTVDEAVALLDGHNIDFDGGPGLHYLVADATGASAVVEFLNGGLRVTPNRPAPLGRPWRTSHSPRWTSSPARTTPATAPRRHA
ncbi:linear amide C-N hydrolase [Actinosynnema sp. NPDC050801]|uniref:linear amide C-N hydrolase n=1 Tax=unclassified Actinosynnema TaxID=2637065 RepID=UPI00340AFAFC